MAAKKTAAVLIVIIIIVVVIVLAYNYLVLEKPPAEGPAEGPVETPVVEEGEGITPPAATGDVDDLVDSLLKEVADEGAVLNEAEGDVAVATEDAKEVDDFGQSTEDEL